VTKQRSALASASLVGTVGVAVLAFGLAARPLAFAKRGADSALGAASFSVAAGGCTTKISGIHDRPLTIGPGVTCLNQATISGALEIKAGAAVSIQASMLVGPLYARGPARLALCGSKVSGPASVTGAAGPVMLGGATSCSADTITGLVTLTRDSGGVTLEGATISGPAHVAGNRGRVTVSGNTIGGPAIVADNTGGTLVTGNTVGGPLSCTGNKPAPADPGKRNTSSGPATGQCSGRK
jgi:hexosaminidase